jgi:hypothetical protein
MKAEFLLFDFHNFPFFFTKFECCEKTIGLVIQEVVHPLHYKGSSCVKVGMPFLPTRMQ